MLTRLELRNFVGRWRLHKNQRAFTIVIDIALAPLKRPRRVNLPRGSRASKGARLVLSVKGDAPRPSLRLGKAPDAPRHPDASRGDEQTRDDKARADLVVREDVLDALRHSRVRAQQSIAGVAGSR